MVHHGAAIAAAALACLQPGIDPVFLTLLSAAHGLDPALHGWIMAATQSGVALGSLLVLRLGPGLPAGVFTLAAMVALMAGLATAAVGDARALLVLRGGFGLAMGMIYAQAMSSAARTHPHSAYGAVFLLQLTLSTLAALIFPALAASYSPAVALAAHGVVPLAALVATFVAFSFKGGRSVAANTAPVTPPDAAAWALAAASLLFICGTMVVWSATAAMAMAGGFSGAAVGRAVAIGSVAGALTAICVTRERSLVPLPLTGLLATLLVLSPVVAIPMGVESGLLLSIIALNIGSTAIIIRCSGRAAARSSQQRFQYAVAFTHSGGLILGPSIGALLSVTVGTRGIGLGAAIIFVAGCAALLVQARQSTLSKTA